MTVDLLLMPYHQARLSEEPMVAVALRVDGIRPVRYNRDMRRLGVAGLHGGTDYQDDDEWNPFDNMERVDVCWMLRGHGGNGYHVYTSSSSSLSDFSPPTRIYPKTLYPEERGREEERQREREKGIGPSQG